MKTLWIWLWLQAQDPARPTTAEAEESTWTWLAELWTRELLKVDGEAITLRKITVGLALLGLGVIASRMIAGQVRQRLLVKTRLTEGGQAALETLLSYLLLILFGVSALKVAGVPLGAFALLGGAVAIGVGFGSQNVISNFISGLILLAERPINVGNLIQVGDLYGVVDRIGARSTRVKTGENVEIIVPNSRFLDENVVNWTLGDQKVRVKVAVGVAYGSPTRTVEELVHKAVSEHPRIHAAPEPIVLFTDFGDNALGFEVHFWIDIRTQMDRRRIESDIRYKLDELFREADITIAFPQRDVHLDTLRPLDVRVLPQETTG